MKLVLASDNKNKLREFRTLFENFGVELISKAESGFTEEVVETGETTVSSHSRCGGIMPQKLAQVTLWYTAPSGRIRLKRTSEDAGASRRVTVARTVSPARTADGADTSRRPGFRGSKAKMKIS